MTGTTRTLPEPATPVASGCITGKACMLQCSFFCALEDDDLDEFDEFDEFDDLDADGYTTGTCCRPHQSPCATG